MKTTVDAGPLVAYFCAADRHIDLADACLIRLSEWAIGVETGRFVWLLPQSAHKARSGASQSLSPDGTTRSPK